MVYLFRKRGETSAVLLFTPFGRCGPPSGRLFCVVFAIRTSQKLISKLTLSMVNLLKMSKMTFFSIWMVLF